MKYCDCGCKGEVKDNKVFIWGHNSKLITPKNAFKKGIIPPYKNKQIPKEVRLKMSNAKKGKIPWNKGLIGVMPSGKNHHQYNPAFHLIHYCIEGCGKEVYKEGNRCQKCYIKSIIKTPNNHPRWKGGITPLIMSIRNSEEYKKWRTQVFQRDNFICQDCGKKGVGDLEAHHIKKLSIIINEFLNTYNQFSPLEDKETLLRLAITYTPFWDITNGKTLCEKCHHKIPKYIKTFLTNVEEL